MGTDIDVLQAKPRAFLSGWEANKFHSMGNLAASLSIRSAEVLEHFQWHTDAQSTGFPEALRIAVAIDPEDVLILDPPRTAREPADHLQIYLVASAHARGRRNAHKYPAGRLRHRHQVHGPVIRATQGQPA